MCIYIYIYICIHPSNTQRSQQSYEPTQTCSMNGPLELVAEAQCSGFYSWFCADPGYDNPGVYLEIGHVYTSSTLLQGFRLLLHVSGRETQCIPLGSNCTCRSRYQGIPRSRDLPRYRGLTRYRCIPRYRCLSDIVVYTDIGVYSDIGVYPSTEYRCTPHSTRCSTTISSCSARWMPPNRKSTADTKNWPGNIIQTRGAMLSTSS